MRSAGAACPAPYPAPAAATAVAAPANHEGASVMLTNPGPATSTRSTMSSGSSAAATSAAISRGLRFAAFASDIATGVARSPCSGFAGCGQLDPRIRVDGRRDGADGVDDRRDEGGVRHGAGS